jgi:hypothetical protein
MNNSPSRHILLIGLPGSGKTSFLAALWYMVGQTSIDCNLTLEKHDGDIKYLNEIRDAWLAFEPVPRNKFDKDKLVSMALKDRETSRKVGLTFPDLSGESFRSQWAKRQLTTSFDNLLRMASGGILFVGPEGITKPYRIDSVEELASEIIGAPSEAAGIGENAKRATKPWDIEKAPTQVQIVELLQIMSGRDHFHAPFRIAIVISAWDRVASLKMSPADYVSNELPLLHQFLQSNQELFEVTFYGLSAQGARYASPEIVATNLKDLPAFLDRLRQKKDAISLWIWGKLDSVAQAYLQQPKLDSKDSGILLTLLVQTLNGLIARQDFYEAGRFAAITLRPDTEYLLDAAVRQSVQNPIKTVRLNRMLLEDAFPTEISREWLYHKEDSTLKQQAPARRISVVGANSHNSHDLTEPIKWLMQ